LLLLFSNLLSQKSFKIIFSEKDSSLEYKKLVTNYVNESYSIIESVALKAFEIPITGNNISLDILNTCLEPGLTIYYKGLKFKKYQELVLKRMSLKQELKKN
tara:strand:- start:148 stop:453 length:306 start_codon:yes stop_codon:yes gene_type:complete